MAKYGTYDFVGKSGKKYQFTVYSLDHEFSSGVKAVYYVTRRYRSGNSIKHTRVYVGQTADLADRLANHHQADCFKEKKANAVCVFRKAAESEREKIEQDLLDNYKPPCNEK